MLFNAMATILAAAAIFLVPGARAAPCPNGTVSVNLTSSGDMQGLIDAMNCTGAGVYDVTVHGRLQIGEIIKVSDHKNVTVTGYAGTATGSGSVTNSQLGNTSDSYAVLDAGNTTGIFLVSDGSTLTINTLVLKGGYSGDGAAIAVTSSSTLTVLDCAFTNNTASMSGGAISANGSEIYIYGDTYFGYNSASSGGAISASHSKIYTNGSTFFEDNIADFGGAMFANNSDVYINGITGCDRKSPQAEETNISHWAKFYHNKVGYSGGAIHSVGGSIIICAAAEKTVFYDNDAWDDGGALSLVTPNKVNIERVDFQSNNAYRGGAICMVGTESSFESVYKDCLFYSNKAGTNGGAIYFDGDKGFGIVNASDFYKNRASGSGGAIYLTGGLKLSTSELSYNTAGIGGVAISSVCASSRVEFEGVFFEDNGMFCPVGQYEPININSDAATFAEVCDGCLSEEREVPAGILNSEWQLPSCKELPTGTVAVSDGTSTQSLTLAKGYYRNSGLSETMLECYRHESCLGGDDIDKYCAAGYEGAYCAVCSIGYSPWIGHSCRNCSADETRSGVGITAVVVIFVVLAAVVALSLMGKVVEDDETEGLDAPQGFNERTSDCLQHVIIKALPAIKIVVVVWQIIFQFAAVAEGVYPKPYETFVAGMSLITLDLSVFMSYSCVLSIDFHERLVLATMLPLVVLTILTFAYNFAKCKYPMSSQQHLTVWSRHMSAGLGVVFFVYSSVSSTIFEAFVCEDINTYSYLRADYSIDCLSFVHIWGERYARVMFLVYPVGIPVSFCWWLVRNRKDLKKSDRTTMVHLEPYSGIWGTYKPSQYYYEIVEYFRRFVISVSSVFLIPDSVNNIAVTLTLTGVFMFVSESLSPFGSNLEMSLYRWGNGVVMASMFVALLHTANASDDESLAVFGWVLIIVNVVMIAAVLAEAVALVREFRGQLRSDAESGIQLVSRPT